jgi:hypothetical protein
LKRRNKEHRLQSKRDLKEEESLDNHKNIKQYNNNECWKHHIKQ